MSTSFFLLHNLKNYCIFKILFNFLILLFIYFTNNLKTAELAVAYEVE